MSYETIRILEKGEYAPPMYGLEEHTLTDEQMEALTNGKRLYIEVEGEYAIVLKY